MSNYNYLYLYWLIPAYLAFLFGHQAFVYYGVIDTYENGSSYTAEVVEFDLKQIAAQTNGYVVLKFTTDTGEEIQRRLSLPIEMAGAVSDIQIVPIRYQRNAFQSIVIMPTYETQKGLALTNMGMALLGTLITVGIGFMVNRYVRKKRRDGDEEIIIERVDSDE
jgi:hypothetical protein